MEPGYRQLFQEPTRPQLSLEPGCPHPESGGRSPKYTKT